MELISVAAGTLGATFLTESIKFLWEETGKIISRYHEKKKNEQEKKDTNIQELSRIEKTPPQFLEISPVRTINFAMVEKNIKKLKELRKELFTYTSGDEEISPEDKELLAYADQLQRLLSEIFVEEVDVPQIKVQQFIESVNKEAEVSGVEANTINKGIIEINQQAKNVEGNLKGAKFESIG